MFTIGLYSAISMGGKFGDWMAPKPRSVHILDAEMTPIEIAGRNTFVHDEDQIGYTTLDLMDRTGRGPWKLGDPEDIDRYTNLCHTLFDVLIVDNIEYTLEPAEGRDIWHPETWKRVEPLTRWAKRHNKLLIFVDHLNAQDQVQGSLSKQRGASFVLTLKSEYVENADLSFTSQFSKCRYMCDADLRRKRTWWLNDFGWNCEKELSPKDQVIELMKEGATQKQITTETNLSQGYVSKIMRRHKHLLD